jgi:hypothetical protein
MSDITEEEIARAIDPEIWADSLPIPTRGDTIDFHARRQESCRKARAVLALLQPALERTREEGYAIGFGASAEGYNGEHPFEGVFTEDPKWQAERETQIAAAIRKG